MPKRQKTMKSTEFRQVCNRLGLDNATKIAKFLHISPRTMFRWLSQDAVDPRTAMLLRVMERYKITTQRARELLDE